MLTIDGIELDFDITCPGDVRRLADAQKAAAERERALPAPDDLNGYLAWLDGLLCIFGELLNEAFGGGVAERLLGPAPSLSRVLEVNERLGKALSGHLRQLGERLEKYGPNRETLHEEAGK